MNTMAVGSRREQLRIAVGVILGVGASAVGLTRYEAPEPTTLTEQREWLFERMRLELDLSPAELERIRAIFERSKVLGQGNPAMTVHPMTREECQERRAHAEVHEPDPRCGLPNMVTVLEAGEDTGTLCMDQFEFPNIACEYPVVHVKASEAVELCGAMGKRICDAHEWEGACAGAIRPSDAEYAWGKGRSVMRHVHNTARELVWAYGSTKNHALCATGSRKTATCIAGGFASCGSNTYPAGAFPRCVSPLGVYDQHGNAAEHMNLPLSPSELASRGGLGFTEMKGSWFVFATSEAHEDDCRWRAPDWHGSRITDPTSHSNYHLGFRCCRDVPAHAADNDARASSRYRPASSRQTSE